MQGMAGQLQSVLPLLPHLTDVYVLCEEERSNIQEWLFSRGILLEMLPTWTACAL